MRSLRSMREVSLKDICKDNGVRERYGLTGGVVKRLEKSMLRWFGHLERANETRLTKECYRQPHQLRNAGKLNIFPRTCDVIKVDRSECESELRGGELLNFDYTNSSITRALCFVIAGKGLQARAQSDGWPRGELRRSTNASAVLKLSGL
ncbi:hypothetical protein EVAR_633_1 [Eumeta japonica]|uniref:Uncharacterized protein n=1 Tax=Eumeta variegata TaxID=151549 RepID=A0A4C1SE91_EUMVA|nr:hypothetical protein EVAR_633_1 [Eumeta japonica]